MTTSRLEPETLIVPSSPYVGLGPYGETDAAFFFGRDEWRGIIIDNLKAYRLTLLYGNSGVGKSSVLRAGVVHELAERARCNYEQYGVSGRAVVMVREWRGDPLATLVKKIDAAAQALPAPNHADSRDSYDAQHPDETAVATAPLDHTEQGDVDVAAELDLPAPVILLRRALASCSERAGGRVFVILDQFEEYFLYHPRAELQPAFETALADAINFRALASSFLISIREDAVALLDRFESKIPGLFNNFLRIGPLDRAEARAAIEQPLEEYGRRTGRSLSPDPRMVEAILDGVETGKVRVGAGGAGVVDIPTGAERDQIETPYLQLVLSRLWDEEHELRWETFERLGRAQGIVQNHLDTTMKHLPERDQDVAAKLFNFLVTPSGTKIAQRADDLANYAEVPPPVATSILERLSGKLRILRPLDHGAYEIYHDTLAPPILDWRSRWQERQQRRRERRKILFLSIAVAVAFLAAGVMVWLALAARSAEHKAQRANATAGDLALASAAQSLLDTRPDVSLVLALVAYRKMPTDLPAVPASMIAALEQARRSRSVGILHGSGNTVTALAFDPRTATLASASADGTVRFWSTRTHRQAGGAFRVPAEVVFSLAYSPDGRTLVTGGGDGRVRFWNVSTGTPIGKPMLVRSGSVISVAYSPDGRKLAAAAYGGGAGLVSIADGKPNGPLTVLPNSSQVRGVAFSADSRTLATVANNGTIDLLDAATGHPRHPTIPVLGYPQLYAVAFSARGPDRIAVAGQSGRIWLMDPSKPVPIPLPRVGTGNVDSLAFSRDGRSLAAATADDTVEVWDVGRQRLEGPPLVGHTGVVTSVAFSPDGHMLASASTDRTIRLWSIPVGDQYGRALGPSLRYAANVSLSRDGQQLAAGGNGGIVLWKADRDQLTETGSQLTDRGVTAVALSPDGRTLVSGGGKKLRVWDTATRTSRPVAGLTDPHWRSIAFSPSGRLVAAAGNNGTITLLDPVTGHVAKVLNPQSGHIFSVAFNRQGTVLASGGDDRVIRIWNVATGHQVAELTGDSDAVFGVAFSPSGTMLASGSADNTVRLWDVRRWREIGQPLTGHHGYVWSVAFTHDSRILASGDDDGVIRFWDVASRTQLGQPFSADAARISSVAFSSSSRVLVSAGADGWVRVWPVLELPPTSALTQEVCGLVGSGLSHAEWKEYAPSMQPYDNPCS